jgi:hypothetical protein
MLVAVTAQQGFLEVIEYNGSVFKNRTAGRQRGY